MCSFGVVQALRRYMRVSFILASLFTWILIRLLKYALDFQM